MINVVPVSAMAYNDELIIVDPTIILCKSDDNCRNETLLFKLLPIHLKFPISSYNDWNISNNTCEFIRIDTTKY